MESTPRMIPLDKLGPATQAQYVRVLRWLAGQFPGPWDRTEPIQAFIDAHPDTGLRTGLRGRVVQSIVNRYLDPLPKGPPIRLPPRTSVPCAADDGDHRKVKKRTSTAAGKGGGIDGEAWLHYVPIYLRPEVRAHPVWSGWIAAYVLAIGATPVQTCLVRTYVTHVYNVLFRRLGCEAAADVMRVDRGALARAVGEVNRGRLPQQRLARVALNRFLADVVLAGESVFAQRLRLRKRHILAAHAVPDRIGHPSDCVADRGSAAAKGRDHFTAAEIAALLDLKTLSVRDRLMLRIMAETGLRRRAVSWLKVENLYDRAADAPLAVGAATEKGFATRRFALSGGARALLAEYIRDVHPGAAASRWVFPSPREPALPITPSVVNSVLVRACRVLGIRGAFTHSHALRKSVVVRLMQENNRIEDVSKWLGHKTLDLTYGVYWDVSERDVTASMTIPWLTDDP